VSYHHAIGFTPDEERELLASQRQGTAAVTDLTAWTRRQDTIRTITIVSIVGGFIYTLARMGDLVAQMRARRRSQPED
jgi:hypothetical protein